MSNKFIRSGDGKIIKLEFGVSVNFYIGESLVEIEDEDDLSKIPCEELISGFIKNDGVMQFYTGGYVSVYGQGDFNSISDAISTAMNEAAEYFNTKKEPWMDSILKWNKRDE